jgi:serine/threonine protein phosphatase PrpC
LGLLDGNSDREQRKRSAYNTDTMKVEAPRHQAVSPKNRSQQQQQQQQQQMPPPQKRPGGAPPADSKPTVPPPPSKAKKAGGGPPPPNGAPPGPSGAAPRNANIPLNPAPGPNFKQHQPTQPGGGAGGGTTTTSKLPPSSKPINRAVDRTDAIDAARTLTVGGITVRYAYLSQRGFYPDDPFKANQDAYSVHQPLRSDDAFFGVFDGHGKDGDGCAIYAKTNLPPNLANILKRTKEHKDYLSKDQVQNALLRAHVDVNRGLHKNPKIDDTLSGTTAISVYFHGGKRNRITVSNVGDSRAVLGTTHHRAAPNSSNNNNNKSHIRALPLSRDQTPYRKDERQRVKAAGARVLSLDQLEGLEPILDGQSENAEDDFELGEDLDEGGDPPRVWHPAGDYPGTAFTRSIGDSVAEDLGVFAEPEMLTREVLPEDKIIVLASDGVFEFLTNQSVIDICAKFSDPLEACRAVVAEAYELWLQYELRTDDITIICIFIDKVQQSSMSLENRRGSLMGDSVYSASTEATANDKSASSATFARQQSMSDDDLDNAIMTTEGLRPVRKHASKEKSKAIAKWKELGKTLHGTDPYDDEAFDWKAHATEKTEEEKRSISDAIKASVMFRNTSEEQKQMIYACMESVNVKAGTWVIQQGSVGDRFYIVDEGQFEVRIVPDGEEDETGQGGHIVHIYEGSREKHAHPSFGELALVRVFLPLTFASCSEESATTLLSQSRFFPPRPLFP